ncbi:Endoglucanase-4 [Apiospora rasikravindrae]|uniref:lytic cellulose monooxygenase (C4-dehydrogenating) n=1 Tax=Apiospora rasikravindrae TaxID=990691 RepID=A0ABR1RP26_9PEZI
MSFTKNQVSVLLAALAAAPALVSAHGHIQTITADGKSYKGFGPGSQGESVGWTTTANDNGFVAASAVGDADIICHRGGKPGALSATVAAGGKVELEWDTWPESHHGPVIDYMAKCSGSCSSVDPSSLEFFKVDEAGLVDGSSQPGKWASDDLIKAGNKWTVTVPADLAEGEYVLRHEMIALHEGNREGGAQFYPQCVNLKVTGGGSSTPAGVKGTSLYKESDPGVLFNIYQANSDYPIPGPKIAAAGGSGGAAPAAPKPAPSAAAPSSAAPAAPTTLQTSTKPAPTQAPATGGSGSGAALYAQCGGNGFSGASSCAEGTCKKQNDYYSQCVPN